MVQVKFHHQKVQAKFCGTAVGHSFVVGPLSARNLCVPRLHTDNKTNSCFEKRFNNHSALPTVIRFIFELHKDSQMLLNSWREILGDLGEMKIPVIKKILLLPLLISILVGRQGLGALPPPTKRSVDQEMCGTSDQLGPSIDPLISPAHRMQTGQ